MNGKHAWSVVIVGLISLYGLFGPSYLQAQQPPTVQIPQPGVPQLMTMEGKFVRAAYNNEGYVILGYQLANRSIGEEWMLLEVGMTVRDKVPDYTLTRDALTLDTPDGKTIPLASVMEYRAAADIQLAAESRESPARLDQLLSAGREPGVRTDVLHRADVSRDAARQGRADPTRACLGRLYFRVPGGITYGQHWLNVKFEQSLIRVPFKDLDREDKEKAAVKALQGASGNSSRTRSSRRRADIERERRGVSLTLHRTLGTLPGAGAGRRRRAVARVRAARAITTGRQQGRTRRAAGTFRLRQSPSPDCDDERRGAAVFRSGLRAGLRLQPRGGRSLLPARGRGGSEGGDAALGHRVGSRAELQPGHR